MEPQYNPSFGGGPQYGPPPGQYPPGQPHRGVPPPGYQVPPPMPPPGPAGYTPPRRSSTGLILGLFSASLALVVVVVTLVLVTSSPATRISDLDAVHEVIEERYERHPFLGVGGFEGKHTIFVGLSLSYVSGVGELRQVSEDLVGTVWEHVPGSYEQVVTALLSWSEDSLFVEQWDTAALREQFGPRPSGLAVEEVDGRDPTLIRPGDCSAEQGYCNSLPEALLTENSRTLTEYTCGLFEEGSAFPTEPFQIRNDKNPYGAKSSVTYLLSPLTDSRPDLLHVALLGKRDAFLEVTCVIDGVEENELFSRAEYEKALELVE